MTFSFTDFFDRTVHDIANCTRKVLISVDYRLAPERPFPVPLQDCLDVTKHVLKHGKALGIDVNSVGVAGDSAGGNLAAAVALALSKEKTPGIPPIKYQILAFPATQAMDLRTPSMVEIGERLPLPSAYQMGGFWAAYLGLDPTKLDEYALMMKYNRHVPPQLLEKSKFAKYLDRQNLPEKFREPRPEIMKNYYTPPEKAGVVSSYDAKLYDKIKDTLVNPLFSPLMAPESDLSGLPEALVIVAEFDVLRDDGLLYAHRLRKAGIKTELFINRGYHDDFFRVYPDFLHSKTGEKSLEAMCSFTEKKA
ncbi:arylacetamide deacetylase [Elysia marginata]|uniref:Arylacetamide deacetylase n=1 Tax=Elysia marginata TaxID=1093978 RepID=A0AAV4GRM9_9GAST|nr:arylacetamide deacetylase [Elysia marginata]